MYRQFDGNCVSVQNELAQQYGHTIPYTSLTHLVRALNLRPEKSQRSGTFTYPPGREAQHDTSVHRVSIDAKIVKAQCASMVLANCRLLFFQYYPRFTRFEAKVFLTEALDYFDGVPSICVIDNTSVLVAAGSGPDAVIAPEMEAFAAIYGMRFVPHAIGHADRSALVERNFHYIEHGFLPGKAFADWQALNAAARNWCDQVANNKIKRALGMTARQAYQSERPFLKPLPAVKPPVYQALSRTVDMYGYVSVDTNRYSVPERLCGKPVEVQKGLYDVRIFHRPPSGGRPCAHHRPARCQKHPGRPPQPTHGPQNQPAHIADDAKTARPQPGSGHLCHPYRRPAAALGPRANSNACWPSNAITPARPSIRPSPAPCTTASTIWIGWKKSSWPVSPETSST